ncbi:MAG TPA: hypothetical protein VMT15_08035 [Bryobacteraceae bacterium]|nr:hypothetical protein [Bryobacteraceae bacterium]
MNMLERYLHAVARLLPKARREDIIEELRTNLLAQMEDREEELGRALTDDEQADILRRHGNPTLVAGRYREPNLGLAFGIQLIGPELFPIYRTVLGMILGITIVILAVVAFLLSRTTHETITLARLLAPLPIQIIVTTLIFILIDRGKDHVLNRWDPRDLPAARPVSEEGPTGRNIFRLLCQAVGTAWLALTPHWPYLMLGPGALYLPAMQVQFWPQYPFFYGAIVALLCAGLVLDFFVLFRWLPRRRARVIELALRGLGLCVGASLLIHGPNYVTSPYKEVANWANETLYICVVIAVAIHVWLTASELRALVRDRHQMLPAGQH